MRCTDKSGFIQRWCVIHTFVQHGVKKAVECQAVGGHDFCVVLRQSIKQEKAKHAALAVAAKRNAGFVSGFRQAVDQAACALT